MIVPVFVRNLRSFPTKRVLIFGVPFFKIAAARNISVLIVLCCLN